MTMPKKVGYTCVGSNVMMTIHSLSELHKKHIKRGFKMEKHRNNSTTSKILEHLQSKGTITPLEALNLYGNFRLSVVINRLRKYHVISTDKPYGGNDYAVYRYICPILTENRGNDL